LFDADHLDGFAEHCAARLGAAYQRDDHARRLGESVGRHIQAAKDFRLVDERMNPQAFLGLEHGALDAPRCSPALPAVQLGEALRRRYFQTADLVEAPLAVKVHADELFDGVYRANSVIAFDAFVWKTRPGA
jgi:hypothetical protein